MQQDPSGVGISIGLDVLNSLIDMAQPTNSEQLLMLRVADNARVGFNDDPAPYGYPYAKKPPVTHRSCPR